MKVLIAVVVFLLIVVGAYLTAMQRSPSCEEVDRQMREFVQSKNFCQADEDCKIMPAKLRCPFGCYALFHLDVDMAALEKYVNGNLDHCYEGGEICEPCASPPLQEEVVCREGKCVDTRFG